MAEKINPEIVEAYFDTVIDEMAKEGYDTTPLEEIKWNALLELGLDKRPKFKGIIALIENDINQND